MQCNTVPFYDTHKSLGARPPKATETLLTKSISSFLILFLLAPSLLVQILSSYIVAIVLKRSIEHTNTQDM